MDSLQTGYSVRGNICRLIILQIFSLKWKLIAKVSEHCFYQSIWWTVLTVKSSQKSMQENIGRLMWKRCYAIIDKSSLYLFLNKKRFESQSISSSFRQTIYMSQYRSIRVLIREREREGKKRKRNLWNFRLILCRPSLTNCICTCFMDYSK